MEFFSLENKFSLSDFGLSGIDLQTINQEFNSIAEFRSLRDDALTFFDGSVSIGLKSNKSKALILVSHATQEALKSLYPSARLVIVDDPRSIFIGILDQCIARSLLSCSSKFPSQPKISKNVKIGKDAVIEDAVQIDDGVNVGSGAIIKSGTWLKSNVTVGENTVIGGVGINLHIGISDGIRHRFPHIAGVIIDEGASIGANAVVVRGTLRSTLIGKDSIISNLCNIGHCVSIGKEVWVSSGTTIGGYCLIGRNTNIGMNAVIKNGVSIGDKANVGMGAVVIKSVGDAESVFGNPARKVRFLKSGPN